jgi:Na+-translocating ferredoxin:NAD+ oxidoreductase RnfG subunit
MLLLLTLTFKSDSLRPESDMSPRFARRSWLRPSAAAVAAIALVTVPAQAAQYWSKLGVLQEFFKTAKTKVAPHTVTLSDAEASAIAKELGVTTISKQWKVYGSEAKEDGYAVLDAEPGMHELIDFAVRISPNCKVQRVEILEYREAYGDEVREKRFRDQFAGKGCGAPLTAGEDIDIVSGASISSRSVALGVKRDALIVQAAIANGSL